MRCRYNLADFIATAATKSSYSLSLSQSISSTATCTTVEFRRPEFFSAQKRDRRENVNSSMKTTHRNAHPTHTHPHACLDTGTHTRLDTPAPARLFGTQQKTCHNNCNSAFDSAWRCYPAASAPLLLSWTSHAPIVHLSGTTMNRFQVVQGHRTDLIYMVLVFLNAMKSLTVRACNHRMVTRKTS